MGLAENQRFILFVLGKLYEVTNRDLKEKILQVSISKAAFIEIVKKGCLTEKGERALYKNLEDLEKSNYVSYENRILKLTKKGGKEYSKLNRQLLPFLNIIKIIEAENPVSLTKKARTSFIGS